MHRVAFVQVVPWHSLVLDELDLRLLFLLLAVLDTFLKKTSVMTRPISELAYTGVISTLTLELVALTRCVTSSVLNTQLMNGSPSSVALPLIT